MMIMNDGDGGGGGGGDDDDDDDDDDVEEQACDDGRTDRESITRTFRVPGCCHQHPQRHKLQLQYCSSRTRWRCNRPRRRCVR